MGTDMSGGSKASLPKPSVPKHNVNKELDEKAKEQRQKRHFRTISFYTFFGISLFAYCLLLYYAFRATRMLLYDQTWMSNYHQIFGEKTYLFASSIFVSLTIIVLSVVIAVIRMASKPKDTAKGDGDDDSLSSASVLETIVSLFQKVIDSNKS